MENEKLIEKIKAWQDNPFVHPLTCLNHSNVDLIPVEVNEKVVLQCPECDYQQERIPSIVKFANLRINKKVELEGNEYTLMYEAGPLALIVDSDGERKSVLRSRLKLK